MPQTINIKEKIFRFITILYIVTMSFPLFADFARVNIPIVCILITVVCIVLYPTAMKNKLFNWMLVYFGVLVLYGLFRKITVPGIGRGLTVYRTLTIEMAFYFPNVVIFSVLRYLNKKQLYKLAFLIVLICLMLSFIYCFILLQQNSNILRENNVVAFNDRDKIPGTPSYALMHAYLLIIPVIMYGFKKAKGFMSIVFLLMVACFTYLVIHTYVTTTLILLTAVFAFFLIYREKKPTVTLILSILVILGILISSVSGLFDSLLVYLNDFFMNTAVEKKLTGGAAYLSGRQVLHQISWRSFLTNPIFGYPVTGGHSNLIDRLGGMGLVCFVPYTMIIISAIKMSLRLLTDKLSKVYYFVCVFCVVVLLYEKGIFNYEGWFIFLVVIPSGQIYFSDYPERKLNNL